MSSYIHFYIRGKKELVPIWTSSRSSAMYQLFNHEVPYEKVRSISRRELCGFIQDAKNEISAYELRLEKIERRRADIVNFNNTTEEKVEALENLEWERADIEEDLEEVKRVFEALMFMQETQDAVVYEDGYDADKYIYAGVECWLPKYEDVLAWERGEETENEDE